MKFEIEIDDEEIAEHIAQLAAQKIIANRFETYMTMTREPFTKEVRKVVQDHKEEIINRAVDKAAAQIEKKGVRELVDRMQAG